MKIVIHDREDEIKAIDFYRADEDPSYMLKNRREIKVDNLTNAHKRLLMRARQNMQEWVSKTIDKDSYNKFYRDVSKVVEKESRLNKIDMVIVTLSSLSKVGYKEALSDENKADLKLVCGEIGLSYRLDGEKLLNQADRAKKGIENDLRRLKKKLESKGGGKFNFIKEFIQVKKAEGYTGSSLDITLAEWAELYKSAIENSQPNE